MLLIDNKILIDILIFSKKNSNLIRKEFYKMAKSALEKATDKDSYLFLNNDIYTYKLEYELSIISCYIG